MLASLILPVLVALVAPLLMKGLTLASSWVNGLPDWPKRAVLLAVSFGLTKLGTVAGLTLPGDLSGLTPDVISAAVTSVLSHFLYVAFHETQPTA